MGPRSLWPIVPARRNRRRSGDVTEHAYDHAALRRRQFRDAGSRIEMLSRLPDLIIGCGSDEELLVRVAGVLLQATPSASRSSRLMTTTDVCCRTAA